MRKFTAIFFILLCGLAVAENLEAFNHSESGLTFPVRLNGFERGEVMELGGAAGSAILYTGPNTAKATLYVYPAQRPLNDEFSMVDQAIRYQAQRTGGEVKDSVEIEVERAGFPGKVARYMTVYENGALFEESHVFQVGDTFYKLRLSGHLGHASELGTQARELTSAILGADG